MGDLHLGADHHQHLVGLAGVGALHVQQGGASVDLLHNGLGDVLGLVADDLQHAAGAGAVHQLVDDGGGDEGHQDAVEHRVDVVGGAFIPEDDAAQQNDGAVHGDGDGADGEMGLQLPDAHNDEVRTAGGGARNIDQGQAHAIEGAGKERGQKGIAGGLGIEAEGLDQIVREEGGDDHALDGFEEKHPPQQKEGAQGYGNVDAEGDGADAQAGQRGLGEVMDDHRHAGDAAGDKGSVFGKIHNAHGEQEAAHHIVDEVAGDCFPAVLPIVVQDARAGIQLLFYEIHCFFPFAAGSAEDGSMCRPTHRTVSVFAVFRVVYTIL